ncbi:MAG: hypothetical protein ACRDZR_12110 [Acidimicrobiales bacterium]
MRLRRRARAGLRTAAGGDPSGAPTRPPTLTGLVPVPTYRDRPATVPVDPRGADLGGRPCHLPVLGGGSWWLLLFLSSRCQGCRQLWEALAHAPGSGLVGDELVAVVTRDAGEEDVAALRPLAPAGVPLVMSTPTWAAYGVQGPPFFALVDGRPGRASRVATEGVAWSVPQVAADVRRARLRAAGG